MDSQKQKLKKTPRRAKDTNRTHRYRCVYSRSHMNCRVGNSGKRTQIVGIRPGNHHELSFLCIMHIRVRTVRNITRRIKHIKYRHMYYIGRS